MIDPKRLLEGEGTEIERLLLASGRAARPSRRGKWRTGILFALVSIGTVSKAHAVALLGAKARAWTVAQWLALGVGTGAAGWVAVHAKADIPPDPPVAIVAAAPRRIPAAPSFHDAQPRVVASPLPAPPAPLEARIPVQAPTPSRAKRSTPLAAAPAGDRCARCRAIDSERNRRARSSSGGPRRGRGETRHRPAQSLRPHVSPGDAAGRSASPADRGPREQRRTCDRADARTALSRSLSGQPAH